MKPKANQRQRPTAQPPAKQPGRCTQHFTRAFSSQCQGLLCDAPAVRVLTGGSLRCLHLPRLDQQQQLFGAVESFYTLKAWSHKRVCNKPLLV